MDFKQLMNLASQNKARVQKQDPKDVAIKSNKSNKSGVSDEAVKAFLAKKELEMKRKAAEKEAARRARIQERLSQSLGVKEKESAVGKTHGKTVGEGQKVASDTSGGKQLDRRKHLKQNEHRAVKEPHQLTLKKQDTDKTRKSVKPESKNGEASSKSSAGKSHKGTPMDFKALLAMAEKNKNGGAKPFTAVDLGNKVRREGIKDQVENVRKMEEQVKKKDEHVKKPGKISEQRQGLKTEQASRNPLGKSKTNGQMHSKGSSKLKDESIPGKPQSSRQGQCDRQDLRHSGLVTGGRQKAIDSKTLPSMAASSSHGMSVSSKTIHPHIDRRLMRGHVSKQRDHHDLKRKRDPFEDEMDDFIDDGDGEEVDVSKYIKEIFGYDRTRFCDDDDDDLAGMESNFSQIEREESKSAKIARLEDEIEQLKELHELKKQRDQLKKKSKK